ncbi:3' terminal RNA ribose 2'-O-methyltransferase Hen1 [Gordonia soli]|uniref:Small RNA 2'-O-methyltransferase n=1 Tax=Gordonia soli NBRC 108243 TaxID=1223545 RepID=M0QKD0_9ACTN|nr:3' terminal RNA ribose 2'-O-methyltransferase Hen1 [Gordonia soli]GAC68746.1 hypothetical protein GS4_18_00340 [Gordonia soli NBRC 108243]
MILSMEVSRSGQYPATDLGYLLHKHPDRVQEFATSQGRATVFYPVATSDTCRAVLHVDGEGAQIDRGGDVDRHVNTVPYAASSRLIVALGKVFGDALAGRCANRPDLVDVRWPLTLTIPSVPVRSQRKPTELFAPLGWRVSEVAQPLSPQEWGDSDFVTIRLSGSQSIRDALRHIAVVIPVLADDKHYFVDDEEIDKLERLGDGWLVDHPHRDDIVAGYVKNLRHLAETASARMASDVSSSDGRDGAGPDGGSGTSGEAAAPHREPLARRRLSRVVDVLEQTGARSVLDVGCGEGRLLAALARNGFGRLAGIDVAPAVLDAARARLDRWPGIDLWQSSLMYADERCRGYDAVVLMEVVEHVDADRLATAMASVFDEMSPRTVVVTTPNREYNAVYGLGARFRHPDHRFEFTRAEFTTWAASVADEYRYAVTYDGIGDEDPDAGTPTQVAVFTRDDEDDS